MFEVSQFDSYSYLFGKPTFISLDPPARPGYIPLAGMRIGINGGERSWPGLPPLDTTITDSLYGPLGQPLSKVGTVIGLEKGPDDDEFFLTFDVLGDRRNVRTDPVPLAPAPPPDVLRPSDIGLRVFDEINATMSALTGVAAAQPAVAHHVRAGEAVAADRREHRRVRLGAPRRDRAARDPILRCAGRGRRRAVCVLPGVRLRRRTVAGIRARRDGPSCSTRWSAACWRRTSRPSRRRAGYAPTSTG